MTQLLDEFVAQTGYCRAYAAFVLCLQGRAVRLGPRVVVVGDASRRIRRQRPRVYDGAVVRVLRQLWELLDFACGKRLAKHHFMRRRERSVRIPNPHGSDIGVPLLREILRQAGIDLSDWDKE